MDGVLKLKAAVPERFVSQVQVGQVARVYVDAYPNREFPGEVFAINPMIDRTSRTFMVEVYVDNPQRELKAGGFAKVDILTHVDPQAWTVPVDAIVTYAGSTKIFVIRDGQCACDADRHRPGRPRLGGTGAPARLRPPPGRPGDHQRPGEAGRRRRRASTDEGEPKPERQMRQDRLHDPSGD